MPTLTFPLADPAAESTYIGHYGVWLIEREEHREEIESEGVYV